MVQPNPFTNPDAPGGGERAPRPRDMVGALVAYSPRLLTPAGAPGNAEGVAGSAPRDRVTTDLYILQTPAPVIFGGSPEYERDPKPHTHSIVGPARFTGVWVSNENIVRALAPGGQVLQGQMVLGRIVRSDIGNRPFNLMSVAETPDMAVALDIWGKLQLGALRYNEAQPLPGFAPAPPASVAYAPPAYAAPLAAAPYGVPAQPVQAAAQTDAFAQWLATQGVNNVPAGPPALPMPAGWQPQAWASLTEDQKRQVLAATPSQ